MNLIRKTILILVVVVVFVSPCIATLAGRIDALISQKSQSKVSFGIKIIKADTGEVVYCHNADKAMMPASNMKVVTTAAALKFLKSDFAFETKVGLIGDSLVIIGSGDPLFGDKVTDEKYGRTSGWIFADIISELKKANVEKIGDIIVDSSVFDDQRVHPNWPADQLNRWYACEVCGVNYNGNCIDMTVVNKGGRTAVSIDPATNYVKIDNKVKAISKGSGAVGAYRISHQPNRLVVKGKCRNEQGPFEVAIERPAAFFGYLLYENLGRAQIKVTGNLVEKGIDQKADFKLIKRYLTPLKDCLERANKDSFGLSAEALLKRISAKLKPDGKGGNWAGGRQIIRGYLTSLGVDRDQFHLDDGSGLSRENRLSANLITSVLKNVYDSKNWQFYRKTLAVGGVDGTIKRYFGQAKYKGKVFGKTGYIAGVKSFSGVCQTDDGEYIFSILTNHATGTTRGAINDIVESLFDRN